MGDGVGSGVASGVAGARGVGSDAGGLGSVVVQAASITTAASSDIGRREVRIGVRWYPGEGVTDVTPHQRGCPFDPHMEESHDQTARHTNDGMEPLSTGPGDLQGGEIRGQLP